MKTPWQYAETGNEFSHQVALFMWAAMATRFGIEAANDPLSYSTRMTAEPNIASDCILELQWLHAIKNAGHGDPIRGARSAAEGVKAGVPDIFLPVPIDYYDRNPEFVQNFPSVNAFGNVDFTVVCGLYIELKRPKTAKHVAGVVATPQTKWKKYLLQAGYAVETCYGWEAARDRILVYLGRG